VSVEVVEAGGIETCVDRLGSGSPLILLHGFTGSIDSMAALAARLAEHHMVISIDLVGHGGSAKPSGPAGSDMTVAVGQVIDVASGLDRPPHLVGYSMGGRVGLSALVAHPDGFRSACVIAAHPGIEDAADRATRRAADDRLADAIEAQGIGWFVDQWMAKPIFGSQLPLGQAHLAEARRQRLRNDPVGLANSLRGMGTGAQPPTWGKLRNVPIPLRYVAGALDTKFVDIGRRLVSTMPNADLVEIADAGHAAHEEQPGVVAGAILDHTSGSEG